MGSLRETISRRAVYLLVLIGALMLILAVKTGYLMLFADIPVDGDDPGARLNRTTDPPRGKIVDRRNSILAISVQRQSLYGNPHQVQKAWKTARRVAPHIEMSAPAVYKRLRRDRYFVWLDRKLSEDQLRRIRKLDLDGLGTVPEYKRVYPKESLAAQVLGFVGVDNQGLGGVERQFNDRLSSVEPSSGPLPTGGVSDLGDPVLRLTIDQTLQHIVEEELGRMAGREEPKNAMVVAMDPSSGEVLALANWPTFDPNRFWRYDQRVRRNRAVADVFEPGSTLKVMNVAAGLAEGVLRPGDEFHCKGYTYLPRARHTLNCYDAHGTLSVPEILIESCNVGAVKSIGEMEPSTLYSYLRSFGFGNWTGIRLPGEAQGTLQRPADWSSLSQPSMAIGQGMSASALQLTTALSAIVNDGVLMKPRVVKGVRRGNGYWRATEPFSVRRVLPVDVARSVQRYMAGVVEEGTGRRAQSEQYQLAGKTGTAQKANLEEGGYHPDRVMASFMGFGPVGEPELVVAVFVDEPAEGRYGGTVAAPVFRRIMERGLQYLDRRDDDHSLVSRRASRGPERVGH